MVCISCFEENVELVFSCRTRKCQYVLCGPCVQLALKDESGANCRDCPMCKTPSAMDMVKSMCGAGAVREVERDLRVRVENEVRKENERLARGKEIMANYEEKADKLFQELAEHLCMKCPRCAMVFDDYDGCNALTCGNASCNAKFCAVCLMDCGSDAHTHARSHGNLFDKKLFLSEKKKREEETMEAFLRDHTEEPFEVRQLIRTKVEQLNSSERSQASGSAARSFLQKAKGNLRQAVKNDRLSLLSEPSGHHGVLSFRDISPRNTIPDDYRLSLGTKTLGGPVCSINLCRRTSNGWTIIPLPDSQDSSKQQDGIMKVVVDSLVNVKYGLQCCTIAFEGARDLYQTSFARPEKDRNVASDEVAVKFTRIDRRTGELSGEPRLLSSIGYSGTRILGFNQNLRMLLLERHIASTPDEELMFDPLKAYIGSCSAQRLVQKLKCPVPDTFQELNKRQQLIAHPLSLRTAMEAAGPPGTGKTKVITELARSILSCTEYHIVILSERNGAVDAIAEKLASDCISHPRTKKQRVQHFLLWKTILAFGSSGIGESSKLFTKELKLRYVNGVLHDELLFDSITDAFSLKYVLFLVCTRKWLRQNGW